MGVGLAYGANRSVSNPQKMYACVQASHEIALTTAGASCPKGEPKVSWSITGPKGARGLKGERGMRGAAGKKGPMGVTGAIGTQGQIGATGPQGPVGATGAIGPQGHTGATGAVGPQGPVGATGPQGPAGTISSNYFDTYESTNTAVGGNSPLIFNTVISSAGGITSPTPQQFTVPDAGAYEVSVNLVNSAFVVQFQKDGGSYGPAYNCAGPAPCTYSEIMQLSAGDVISVINAQSGGSTEFAGSSLMILQVG